MGSNDSSSIDGETDDKMLAIGKERINLRTASSRLGADIQFLRERIDRMKQFNKPNEATLKIYEDMLKNRESILAWLEDHHGVASNTGSLTKSA